MENEKRSWVDGYGSGGQCNGSRYEGIYQKSAVFLCIIKQKLERCWWMAV